MFHASMSQMGDEARKQGAVWLLRPYEEAQTSNLFPNPLKYINFHPGLILNLGITFRTGRTDLATVMFRPNLMTQANSKN